MPITNATLAPKETITAKMSRWAASLQYKDISADAVYQAKRFLLDSLGCALGGYQQHDVKIALEVLDEIAAIGLATVIGSGRRIDPVSASLANALMIRCMDYNDIYWKQDPSHPSDIFPAAIACCERASGNGKELIVGLVLGHEFEMRLCEAAFPGIRERGWHHATLTAFVSPIVAGRALHLSWEQIQHAIGISASRHCTLRAVTAGKLTMMKNTVDPMATQSGVFAALLAKKGYSGPEHVIDGKEGLAHVFKPDWKLDLLTDGLGEYSIGSNPRHVATSPFTSYNYHGKGNFASMVDAVVLGATEVDANFNANVVTHSDGRLLYGIGGWQNCLASGCTILAVPSFRDRIPVIVDEVTTLCGPGELVDVVATERGIAINPRRQDLIDAVKGSTLPIRPIEDIKKEVERICGGKSRRPQRSDKPVAIVKWVDGTVLDTVWQIA